RENEVPATCTEEGANAEIISCTERGAEPSRVTKTTEKLAHTPGEPVRENEVPATCTAEGSYDEVIYCTECGAEISRVTKTTEKLAHTPGEPVRENEVPATCTAEGSYDEVIYCTECGAEISRVTKTTEKLAHTPGEVVIENEVPATCTAEGSYDEVIYCEDCHAEISRVTKTIEKLAHTPGEPVRENEVPATPFAPGSYDEVVYCTICGEEISRETKEVPALKAKFYKGNTVSFKDNLTLNFFVDIDEDLTEGAYVVFTYNHYGEVTQKTVELNPDDMYDNKYYRFRCPLTASEMMIDVQADLYVNGYDTPVSTKTRSVRDWAESGLEDPESDDEYNLILAALNYGGYAQQRFGYNPAPYANVGYEYDADLMNSTKVKSAVEFVKPEEMIEGIKYRGATVLFRNAPFVRLYFKLADGASADDYLISINGENKTLQLVDGNYFVDVEPALAYELDTKLAISVLKKTEAAPTSEYGDEFVPMDWDAEVEETASYVYTELFSFDYSTIVWAKYAAEDEKNTEDRDLAKALYLYYVAAKTYVDNKA
nr:hypothetical protein [Oscillospiraceae bacterium]